MLASLPAHADATLLVRGSDGLQSTVHVRNGKGKVSADGMEEYIIFDTGAATVTYVEPQEKRYTQVSRETLETSVQTTANLRNSVSPYVADMLSSLSPSQRRMIEQRMGAVLAPPAAGRSAKPSLKTVARGSHTIAGLHCKASSIIKKGRSVAELCMATSASGKLSRHDFITLKEMVKFSRSIASSARGVLGSFGEQLEILAVDVDGVPLGVRDMELNKRYQVTSVSNTALPDAIFNDYGRYEKRNLPSLLHSISSGSTMLN
jgi:hypothetical protein